MALWTPASISTDLWFDAADASTVTLQAGGQNRIIRWDSKCGNGRYAVQSGGYPRYVLAAQNGHNVIQFTENEAEKFYVNQAGEAHSIFRNIEKAAVFCVCQKLTSIGLTTFYASTGSSATLARVETQVSLVISSAPPARAYAAGRRLDSDVVQARFHSGSREGYLLTTNIFDWAGALLHVGLDGVLETRNPFQTAGLTSDTNSSTMCIGYAATGQSFNGMIAEIVVVVDINDEKQRRIEGYLAHKWGIASYLPVSHPYRLVPPEAPRVGRRSELKQSWGLKLGADLIQAWGDNPIVQRFLYQPWGDAGVLRSALLHRWRDVVLLSARFDQPYRLSESLLATLKQRWALTLGRVTHEFMNVWNLYDRSVVRQQFSQSYWIEAGNNVITPGLEGIIIPTVTTDNGQLTSVVSLSLESSSDLFVITATVGLGDYSEWKGLNKGDKVFINNVLGTTFSLMVESLTESKTAESREYVVELISETVKLDLPYAKVVNEELSGMASQIVSQLAITTLTQWNAVDWFIPPGLLFLDDEPPINGIRRVTGAIKAVIGTTPGGVLTIEPRYKKSVIDITQDDIELELLEASHVVSINYNTTVNPGYNSIIVSDNALGANNTIRVKTERISEFVTDIIVETTPWRETYLSHSGGAYVSIQDMFIEEVQETDELVEFIEGEGVTSRTIHEVLRYNWRERNLGAVSHEQSGALRASILGDSLLIITYLCRQQRWRVRSSEEGPTQFIIEDTDE